MGRRVVTKTLRAIRGSPRSCDVRMMGSRADVLRSLATALDTAGAGWYLFGAQAVVAWEHPRFMEDIDVTVAGTPARARALISALENAGFRLRVADVDEFVGRTWVLPVEHVVTGEPVDVVIGGSGLEEQFLSRARRIELGGVIVPVISPEDLIVSKILAGRPKDLEDVVGVLQLQGGQLRLAQVRELLSL